ncbi:MAG: ion transporter [Bacteroidales bacterium]|jgi:voltage-gated potassium channel|nr:ion transporter [Bacteroidales bacterium]
MLTTRQKIYNIIFGTETRAGKNFDIILLILIVASVSIVILESIIPLRTKHTSFFVEAEWVFTAFFTLEYLFRVYSHPKPLKYITSFLGIIDLLAILPTFLGLFFDQITFLLTIRAFRLLRVFRILKLTRYLSAADQLQAAMRVSARKIIVFFEVVILLVLFLGSIMYMVEGEKSGFTSIPQSIYWAIVTITTVGYGDIAPMTVIGKMIASVAMLTGYSIIAVPTGIITVEMGKLSNKKNKDQEKVCEICKHVSSDPAAKFCSRCGNDLYLTDNSKAADPKINSG